MLAELGIIAGGILGLGFVIALAKACINYCSQAKEDETDSTESFEGMKIVWKK